MEEFTICSYKACNTNPYPSPRVVVFAVVVVVVVVFVVVVVVVSVVVVAVVVEERRRRWRRRRRNNYFPLLAGPQSVSKSAEKKQIFAHYCEGVL